MITFPAAREALEAAGYRFEARKRCREAGCGKTVELWKSPAIPPKWKVLEAVFKTDPNTLVEHWKFCTVATFTSSLPPAQKQRDARPPRKPRQPQRRLFR